MGRKGRGQDAGAKKSASEVQEGRKPPRWRRRPTKGVKARGRVLGESMANGEERKREIEKQGDETGSFGPEEEPPREKLRTRTGERLSARQGLAYCASTLLSPSRSLILPGVHPPQVCRLILCLLYLSVPLTRADTRVRVYETPHFANCSSSVPVSDRFGSKDDFGPNRFSQPLLVGRPYTRTTANIFAFLPSPRNEGDTATGCIS